MNMEVTESGSGSCLMVGFIISGVAFSGYAIRENQCSCAHVSSSAEIVTRYIPNTRLARSYRYTSLLILL
jgi:hypothetical protein